MKQAKHADMMCHQSRFVAARFSAASDTYHERAQLQETVADRLMELMGDDAADPGRILEIGCGTGVLTERVRRRWPGCSVDAVDCSSRMLESARRRFPADRKIRWLCADVCQLPPLPPYPLILSSSALHWVRPLSVGITTLARLLPVGGKLAIALMVDGTLGELHAARLNVAPDKKPRGRLPTMSDVVAAVNVSGLHVSYHREERIRMEYASARDLLRWIHAQGLTGGVVSASDRSLTRRELCALESEYQRAYAAPAGVYATYAVCYCVATRQECDS